MRKIFALVFTFLFLLTGILFIGTRSILAAGSVSPDIDAQNGFPTWYADNLGNKVVPCLDGADPNCVLPAAGEEPNFNPGQLTVFPSNFPSEFFYWIAESDSLTTPGGGKTFIRVAVEGAFANGGPLAGDQMVFGRIRATGTGLTPNSTYTVTHPYGTTFYRTDDTGKLRRNTSTEDLGCTPAPGFPCNFSIALISRVFNGFLKWNTGAPAGYLGDGVTPHTVVGSPTGNNFFKITGPGLPAGGLSTNLFTVSGKLFTPPPPSGCTTNTAPAQPTQSSPANRATGVATNPTLAWNALADFGCNTAGNNNQFEVFLDQGNVNPTTSKGLVPSTQTTMVITALLANTTYSWKVRATNGALSTDSALFTFTTAAACTNTAPGQATLNSPANTATGVALNPTLAWTNPGSFGTNCAGNNNQVEVFLDQGNVNPTTSKGVFAATQTSLGVSGLLSNTTYSWKVRTTNGALTADSIVFTFITLNVPPPTPPAAPSFLTSLNSGGNIQLKWFDKSTNETEFRIERKLGLSGVFGQIATTPANSTTYTDTAAPVGVLGYRVRACNGGGCSAYSNTTFVIKR